MRRLLVPLLTMLPMLLLSASPVSAAVNHRPRLRITSFVAVPGEGSAEYWLGVDAVDHDGVIWEVQVRFGDGSFTWADTFCVQGPETGRLAHLEIPHAYAAPGRYVVQARAVSVPACYTGGEEQLSHWAVKAVTVRP